MRRKGLSKHLPPIILIALISLYSVRGYLFNLTNSLPTTGSDDAIITWILNQTITKIPNDLGQIFNGNIFYPYENTLAYSIMMVPSAIISYIPAILTGSYLTAFNFTVVFSQLTTGIVLYLLFFEVSENKLSASIASIALTLSNIRMSFGVHIHLFVMQYFLLAVYFFIKFKKTEKLQFLYLTFLFLGIQVWESLIQVIFALIIISLVVLSDLNILKGRFKHLIYSSVLAIIVAAPPALSYIKVALDFGKPRNIREVAHFSAGIDQIFTNHWSTGLYMLFFISMFLVVFAKLRSSKYLSTFLFITLIGFLFCLGPVLKFNWSTVKFGNMPIPLPYLPAYYLFPPLWAIRSVHRFVWLMAFGMAGVVSVVLPSFNKRFLKLFFLPLTTIAILGGVYNSHHYHFPSPDEYKNVYHFIKDSDVKAIAEYPFFGVNNNHGEEMKRMVYSLYHQKGLYNGASGFVPGGRVKNISLVRKVFPEYEFIEILQKDSVDYFVLHKEFIDDEATSGLRTRYSDHIVYEDKDSLVLDIRKI